MTHDGPSTAPGDPTRRDVLGGALALPALAATSAMGAAGRLERREGAQEAGNATQETPAQEPTPAEALEAFYARWIPRARALVAQERPEEDAFLFELCADLVRHEPSFFPGRRLTVYAGNGLKTGPVGRDDVFQLVEVVLEPGAVLPAHNHVGYAFVTLCLEGEARVRHYEPEPGSPDPLQLERDFLVREVQDLLLVPGRCSTLSRTRANVHTITAGPAGVRLLDFGIKFPPSDIGPTAFSALEVEVQSVDAVRGLHTARWIGNIYAKDYQRKQTR